MGSSQQKGKHFLPRQQRAVLTFAGSPEKNGRGISQQVWCGIGATAVVALGSTAILLPASFAQEVTPTSLLVSMSAPALSPLVTETATVDPSVSASSAPTTSPSSTEVPIPSTEPTEEPTPPPSAEPTENPEPTQTPEPSLAPTPTVTPTPSAEPTQDPSLTPSPTSEPSQEPTNTPEPTSSPTPEPTVTPTPEPTASPTPEPTPTPTPEPTVTPTPEPTPEPTVAPPTTQPPLPSPSTTAQPVQPEQPAPSQPSYNANNGSQPGQSPERTTPSAENNRLGMLNSQSPASGAQDNPAPTASTTAGFSALGFMSRDAINSAVPGTDDWVSSYLNSGGSIGQRNVTENFGVAGAENNSQTATNNSFLQSAKGRTSLTGRLPLAIFSAVAITSIVVVIFAYRRMDAKGNPPKD